MNLKSGEYWEVSKKALLRFSLKNRKFNKNCGVKTELLFVARDL